MLKYFAYGSNMDHEQIISRCPSANYVGVGFMPDYKLAFTRNSRNWNSAVADVLISPSDVVWGVVYELSMEDLNKLDIHEGHPNIYQRKNESIYLYKGASLDLINIDDNVKLDPKNNLNNFTPLEVNFYEVVHKELNLVPTLNYLSKLQDAAFLYCFPKAYQLELYLFGQNDYEDRLRIAIDTLIEYQSLLEKGDFPLIVKKQEEWGGANLVITGKKSRKDQLNRDYPHDLVVLTPCWRELSWFVHTLYWDKKVTWQVDYTNKHYVLNHFGMAALDYQREFPDCVDPKGICLAVLYRAYKVFTCDFYKMY